jgi:hypothetical protein
MRLVKDVCFRPAVASASFTNYALWRRGSGTSSHAGPRSKAAYLQTSTKFPLAPRSEDTVCSSPGRTDEPGGLEGAAYYCVSYPVLTMDGYLHHYYKTAPIPL